MKLSKKSLPELADRKLESLRKDMEHRGIQASIHMYQEHGYYTLMINQKPILSVEGLEPFFYALIGFRRGTSFAWYD